VNERLINFGVAKSLWPLLANAHVRTAKERRRRRNDLREIEIKRVTGTNGANLHHTLGTSPH